MSRVRAEPSWAIAEPCPLCRADGARLVWRVGYDEVWSQLRSRWHAEYPSAYRARWDAVGEARLHECTRCGLQFFSPLLPGDATFYEVISRDPAYYVDDRWEFGRVLASVQRSDAVVDFGSGEGAFLRRAAAVARRVVGCDHNGEIDTIELHGAELRRESFADVARELAGTFDVATSFHVLEHLDDVDALCGPATLALRSGGRLFLSTPDRQRSVRNDVEALDCPPHHVSRWSPVQYEALADRYGLRLVGVHHEPFVQVTGWRRSLPRPVLHALAIVRRRARGDRVLGPRHARGGPWPRGDAVLAELVKP